jgi:hypothetical protein
MKGLLVSAEAREIYPCSTCACGRISSGLTPDFARRTVKRGSFQIVIRTPRRPHAVTLPFAGSALFLPTTLKRGRSLAAPGIGARRPGYKISVRGNSGYGALL